jgi:hypothetical protein
MGLPVGQTLDLEGIATEPAAPPAGELTVYAKNIGGRMMLKQVGPSGVDTPLQPHIGFNGVTIVRPNTTTTTTTLGGSHLTTGTISNPTISGGSIINATRRLQFASAGTAGASAESRMAQGHVMRGDVAGAGGWFGVWRIVQVAVPAGCMMFAGLQASTAALGAVTTPSSLLNMVGIGYDSGDTNLQVMVNDGAGTATKVDLGASFPVRTTSHFLELVLFCAPNGGQITYRVTRLEAPANQVSGTLATDLPVNTTPLCSRYYMTNNATASAATFATPGHYVESDF